MSDKPKLNLCSLNKRLTKLEETEPTLNDSAETDELIERINILEKIVFNVYAQPQKEKKKPLHPEVWDPSVCPRPKKWGREYSPPVQKTPDGVKAHPKKEG